MSGLRRLLSIHDLFDKVADYAQLQDILSFDTAVCVNSKLKDYFLLNLQQMNYKHRVYLQKKTDASWVSSSKIKLSHIDTAIASFLFTIDLKLLQKLAFKRDTQRDTRVADEGNIASNNIFKLSSQPALTKIP